MWPRPLPFLPPTGPSWVPAICRLREGRQAFVVHGKVGGCRPGESLPWAKDAVLAPLLNSSSGREDKTRCFGDPTLFPHTEHQMNFYTWPKTARPSGPGKLRTQVHGEQRSLTSRQSPRWSRNHTSWTESEDSLTYPRLDPILRHTNTNHTTTPYFKLYFNIFLPSKWISNQRSIRFRSSE